MCLDITKNLGSEVDGLAETGRAHHQSKNGLMTCGGVNSSQAIVSGSIDIHAD